MSFVKNLKHKIRVIYQKTFPYSFDLNNYSNTFLINDSLLDEKRESSINKIIYCFWTGENEMSENRKKAVESLRNNSQVEICLIGPHNLHEYILEEHPLHPSYEQLSLIHKSDYLRCYFMHHYGGGYSDIKEAKNSWLKSFEKIENSGNSYVLGYREVSKRKVAVAEGKLGADMQKYYSYLLGNGAYICAAKTKFTEEWYKELSRRMDAYSVQLSMHPGNTWGDNEGYPIPWSNILGDIFHPLCLKYHKRLMIDDSIRPILENYR